MYSLGMNGFWKKPENWYGVLQATSVFDHALVSLSLFLLFPSFSSNHSPVLFVVHEISPVESIVF